jgi:hypothetical protein
VPFDLPLFFATMTSIPDVTRNAMFKTKFKPDNSVAYDKTPVQLKVLPGVRDRLRQVPNWQGLIREYINQLISKLEGG